MIASKFGIGQQVRHTLLGYLGVVVDIDPEYSLDEPSADDLAVDAELRAAPWYHVVMEGDDGQPVHTYLAEAQLVVNYRMSIRNNPLWTSLLRPSANSYRHQDCATKGVKKPVKRAFLFCQPQTGNIDCRTAIHHHLQPGIARQHGRLLINHAQLHPQRFRADGNRLLRHAPGRL